MATHAEPALIDSSAASAPSDVIASDAAKMRRFLHWMQEHGATISPVSVKGPQGSRQVHATRPLYAGGLVAQIPRRLTITPEVAKDSETGRLIAKHGSNVDDYDYLAAYLFEIKRKGGFWKPYVDILPTDYSENPLFFSESVLNELKGSYILNSILNRIAQQAYRYDQFPPCLKENGFTPEEYAWAKCVVNTRVHGATHEGRPILAMVPLSDMFDHAIKNNADWAVSATGYFIRAEHPIEAGARLFEGYGRCNAQLLNEYGFCIEDNPLNVAEIRLQPLSPDHPFFERANKLGKGQWSRRTFKVAANCNDAVTQELFSFLRLACHEEPPHLPPPTGDADNPDKVPPISRQNEVAALVGLAQACEGRLKQFPTSIEDDEALLKDGSLQRNLRNVVMVRRDEKIILRYFHEFAQTALAVLRDPSCNVAEHAVAGKPYADYFAGVLRILERTTK
jgi:hypothetical protein